MPTRRYLTTYILEEDEVKVYTEDQKVEVREALAEADEWVWQFASNKTAAILQHFDKLDEWERNPGKDTY